jgi:centriolar protein POC1
MMHRPLAFLALGLSLFCQPAFAGLRLIRHWQASPVLLQHVEYSPGGTSLLTASGAGIAQLWQLNGQPGPVMQGQRPPMFNAHFNGVGDQIVTTGYDGSVWIWDSQGQRLYAHALHQAAVAEARFFDGPSGFGPGLITSSDDGQFVIRHANGAPLWSTQFSGTARQFSISPSSDLIVASSDDGQLHLIRPHPAAKTASVTSLQTPHGRINQVSFSPDARQFAVAGKDGTVSIWTRDGTPKFSLQASRSGWSRGAAYCATSPSVLLTIGDDGNLMEWSRTGQLLGSLRLSQTSSLTSIDCSPAGRHVSIVGSQGELWLVAITSGER